MPESLESRVVDLTQKLAYERKLSYSLIQELDQAKRELARSHALLASMYRCYTLEVHECRPAGGSA